MKSTGYKSDHYYLVNGNHPPMYLGYITYFEALTYTDEPSAIKSRAQIKGHY